MPAPRRPPRTAPLERCVSCELPRGLMQVRTQAGQARAGVPCASFALQRLECPAQDVRDLVDVLLLGDQRRRDDRGIAGRLEIEAVREQFLLEALSALAGCPVSV